MDFVNGLHTFITDMDIAILTIKSSLFVLVVFTMANIGYTNLGEIDGLGTHVFVSKHFNTVNTENDE